MMFASILACLDAVRMAAICLFEMCRGQQGKEVSRFGADGSIKVVVVVAATVGRYSVPVFLPIKSKSSL